MSSRKKPITALIADGNSNQVKAPVAIPPSQLMAISSHPMEKEAVFMRRAPTSTHNKTNTTIAVARAIQTTRLALGSKI